MDAGRTPLWIFLAHPSDKVTQAPIDPRPPCPIAGFPAPERLEACTMPPKDGLRLNNAGRTEQAWPELGHPYQQRPVTAAQSDMRSRTPQGDTELMTEKQILGFKPASRLEQIGEIRSKQVDDRKLQAGGRSQASNG